MCLASRRHAHGEMLGGKLEVRVLVPKNKKKARSPERPGRADEHVHARLEQQNGDRDLQQREDKRNHRQRRGRPGVTGLVSCFTVRVPATTRRIR